jgi:hypothetical protein
MSPVTPPLATAGASGAPTTPPVAPPITGTGGAGTITAPPMGIAGAGVPMMPGAPGEFPDPLADATCPEGFEPQEGTNTGFPTEDSGDRQFVVMLPPDLDPAKPAPVMMVLTGTVESTMASMTGNSRLSTDLLPKGWVLIGPVRQCSSSPDDGNQSCSSAGSNGWNWRPWNEGAATGSAGMQWWDDEGPDARFMKSMVKCASTKWKLDGRRLFVVGISSGGTMTNRLLTFQSDFWAGGVPESGEWYVQPNNAAAQNSPKEVFPGRCCPLPELPEKLGPMFIVVSWGGPNDMWQGLSVYGPSCQTSSNYFSMQPDVINVSCAGTHGHRWQPVAGFNAWFADLLYAHPKGSTIAPNNTASYMLPAPAPMPYQCEVGRFTTIFGE